MTIDILSNNLGNEPKPNRMFWQQPRAFLIYQYDTESKRLRRQLTNYSRIHNIKHIGIFTLVINRSIINKNINILIHEENAKRAEEIVLKHVTKEQWA